MSDEKVFKPTEIEDTPLPDQIEGENFSETQKTSNQTFGQRKIKDQRFPVKKIATELLSSSLNTKTKKILAEFQFTESGALQIGKFLVDVSGDLRITPNGITARDKKGDITFALDATTGDAVFKGSVQAGSLISGSVIVGGKANIDGSISVLDNYGAPKVLLNKDGILIN